MKDAILKEVKASPMLTTLLIMQLMGSGTLATIMPSAPVDDSLVIEEVGERITLLEDELGRVRVEVRRVRKECGAVLEAADDWMAEGLTEDL